MKAAPRTRLRRLRGYAAALLASLACVFTAPTASGQAEALRNNVTAIDIVIEPDDVMIRHAEAANARLLAAYPVGAPNRGLPSFPLDASHRPHITIIQRYVTTADLEKIYSAVDNVLGHSHIMSLKLEAFKYYYIPYKNLGVAGIVIRPLPELVHLQQAIADAVAPFTVKTGTAAAYVTTPEDPEINAPTRDYVENFVPRQMGANYNPHVTTGVGMKEDLDKLLAAKFDSFTFSPAGVSVYQLGNNGTARKLLRVLKVPL